MTQPRRSQRSAASLIEVLLAIALGVVVLGGAIAMLASFSRFTRSGELAAALQEAALVMANIERDAVRALATPDGKIAIRITANEMRLAVGDFTAERVAASLVTYQPEPQPNGGFRLRRSGPGRSGTFPALLERYRFETLGGPGGPYLRVTLHVAGQVAPPGNPNAAPAREAAVLSALVRLAGTELAGSKFCSMSFLDAVTGVLGP